jgi:hypothetical protein
METELKQVETDVKAKLEQQAKSIDAYVKKQREAEILTVSAINALIWDKKATPSAIAAIVKEHSKKITTLATEFHMETLEQLQRG